jgi:short-subunit dehydrogenase
VDRRTALVTGASSGIGRELALIFASNGYDLVLVARSRQGLEDVAAQARGLHVNAHVITADLARPGAPDQIRAELHAASIPVDILVNNAGFAMYGPFIDANAQTEAEMMQVNMATLTQMTRTFLPGMVERHWGRILNLSSLAGFMPGPLMAVYYATKAYVLSFSEALADELHGTGVTVTALAPPATSSGFQRRAAMEDSKLVQGRIMDARTVAEAGYRGLMAGRSVVVPGLSAKLLAFSVRLSPRWMVTRIVRRMQERVS